MLGWRHPLAKCGTAARGGRCVAAARSWSRGGLCAAVVDAFRGRNASSLSSPGLERPKLEGQAASEGSLKGLVLLKVPQHSSANSAVSYALVHLFLSS